MTSIAAHLSKLRRNYARLRQDGTPYAMRSAGEIGGLARANAKWNLGFMVLRQLFGVLTVAVLARLLMPRDFGLLAMALIFTGILGLIDLALGWTTVQSADLDSRAVNGLFWVGCSWGLGMWGICALLGPVLARFYGQPELSAICGVVGAGIFFNSLATQPIALLKRQMRQFAVSGIETFAAITASVIAVGLALAGWKYWALVAQAVLLSLIRLILAFSITRLRVRWPELKRADAKRFDFSAYMGACHWVVYLQQSIDSVLVGWLFGSVSLGLYNRALALKNLPTLYTVNPLNDVMIPAFAAVRKDKAHLGRVYLKALTSVAFVGCPAGAFLGVAAPELVHLLYGPNWVEVVPLVTCLSLVATVWPIHSTAAWLLIGTGSSRVYFWVGMGLLAVSCVAYATAMTYGVLPVAMAHCFLFGLLSPVVTLYWAHRASGLPSAPTARIAGRVLLACVIAAVAALAAAMLAKPYLAGVGVLAIKAVVGGAVYLIAFKKILGELPLLKGC